MTNVSLNSKNEPILVSSDDESDYGDYDDDQSGVTFPPTGEVPLRRERHDMETDDTAGLGLYLNFHLRPDVRLTRLC